MNLRKQKKNKTRKNVYMLTAFDGITFQIK